MKTVKFLSFLMLMSLAWISCEDRTKVKVTAEAENTENTLDDAFTVSRNEFNTTIGDLKVKMDARIQEVEKDLETATDEAKADINVKLDGLRKQRNDLDQLGNRIGNATAEGWADMEREAAEVIADIKIAIQ